MLSELFDSAARIHRLRAGPAGAELDEFAHVLSEVRYAQITTRRHVRAAEHFVSWADRHGISVSGLSEDALDRFGRHVPRCRCAGFGHSDRGLLHGAHLFLRHLKDSGTITVAAHNLASSGVSDGGEYVAISVRDTGTGIAPDVLDKIFDPFFTTKPIGKGTGLGLSQVHGFAHQAGGTVKVASELGKGTRITILLPRKEIAPAAEDADAVEIGGSGTVLLVEDNPDVASVSAGLLEQLGYTVRRVANAEAALREIDLDGVDLVFSDIVMPGKMDGLALAHRLREIRPGLPILLATGYSDAAVNVRGDFPILRKPYEIHELSEAIAKLPR